MIRLRQTVEGLLKTVASDGRIHTTYNQIIAATGRLSSTDPNLQNIPIRTEAGRRIREGFVVGEGYESLMTADYSQVEMRIMAHLSEDELLIEAFRSGQDFHSITAARVFDVDAAAVSVEQRAKIKAMNYGLAYGLSAFGLSQQLRIDTSEARGLMDEYFETFGGVRDYLGGIVDEARRSGFTETILGRRRYLPDLTSDNRMRRGAGRSAGRPSPRSRRPRRRAGRQQADRLAAPGQGVDDRRRPRVDRIGESGMKVQADPVGAGLRAGEGLPGVGQAADP